METYSAYLNRKFREWEKSTGRKQTVTSFSRYLEVKQPSLTRWMQGDNPPSMDNLIKISNKFGNEIFSILEIDTPQLTHQSPNRKDDSDNPLKHILDYKIDELSDEDRSRVLEYIEFLQHQRHADIKYNREGVTPPEVVK